MRRGILERFRAAYGDRPFALLAAGMDRGAARRQAAVRRPQLARDLALALPVCDQARLAAHATRRETSSSARSRATDSTRWTDDEIAQFEAHHPIGTKPRLAFALLLYTAQRRSDVVRIGRQHIRDGVLTVKQQKTGVTLAIPVHPHLQSGARRHAERTFDVPGHRDRQAVRRELFQRELPGMVRRSRVTKALLGTWAAQGGMPPTRGSTDAQPTRS